MQRKGRNRRFEVEEKDKHRINDAITSSEVRVITEDGEQKGTLTIQQAIALAEEQGLDLVEVAPGAEPPVCKLLDYGKLRYKEQKKAAEARKKTATQEVKEIRIRYSTDSHDLETKVKQATKFLSSGDKVRFSMRFRGREVVYRELGEDIFNQLAERLSEIASLEERAPLVHQKMHVIFAPK